MRVTSIALVDFNFYYGFPSGRQSTNNGGSNILTASLRNCHYFEHIKIIETSQCHNMKMMMVIIILIFMVL
jgi:hypothetical protein